jgi:hypothetical protein
MSCQFIMINWEWRLSVAVVVLLVFGSVVPGVAGASVDGPLATGDEITAQNAGRQSSDGSPTVSDTLRAAVTDDATVASDGVAALGPTETFAAAEPVSECRVIDSPGVYRLTADVTDSARPTCIDIRSSDVVFDGQGHTIDGVDSSRTSGVFANGTAAAIENVTVRNLTVSDWASGVAYRGATGGLVEDVVAESNDNGFSFDGSDGNTLVNVSAVGSGSEGFDFSGSGESWLTDVSAEDSDGRGFAFTVDSGDNTLVNVSATDSGSGGFIFASDAGNNTFENVSAENSGGNGFTFLYVSGDNTLRDVSAAHSGGDGFLFAFRESGDNSLTNVSAVDSDRHGFQFNAGSNVLDNVTARESGLGGFDFYDDGGNTLTNVSAVDGESSGFEFQVADNTLTDVSAVNNTDEGFVFFEADDTALTRLTAADNAIGLLVSDSDGVRVDGGVFENNTGDGIRLEAVWNTTVRSAVVRHNGRDGVHVDDGNGVTVRNTNTRGNGRWGVFTVNTSGTYTDTTDTTGVSYVGRNVVVDDPALDIAPPTGRAAVGPSVEAVATGSDAFFDVTVRYDQTAVDAADVNESTVTLFAFDGSTWTPVQGSVVDTTANTVSANVTEFGVFAPLGAVESDTGIQPGLTIDAIPDQTVTAGESIDVPVTVSGVDTADPPTLSLDQHPGFVSLSDDGDGAGTMTLGPQSGDVGTYTVEVNATNDTTTATETFTVTVEAATQSGVVFAVNAGGPEYTASDGTVYAADTGFDGGFTFSTGSYGTPSDPEINDTDDDTLYRSERYGGSFSYDVPVSNGTYEVTLQFAEIYQGVSTSDEPDSSGPTDGTDENDRVFDVSAEGEPVVSDYDIFADVGPLTATEVTYTVEVTDGVLNLEFTAINDHAKVSAITVSVPDGEIGASTTDA